MCSEHSEDSFGIESGMEAAPRDLFAPGNFVMNSLFEILLRC